MSSEPRRVSQLSPETLLVRQDVIRPGDVLLSYGRAMISKVIALDAGGKFSHASVFVSRLDLIESYELVAHARIEPVGQTIIGGKKVYLAKLPHDPIRAEIWRHPQADGISWSHFQEVTSQILQEHWGKDYSKYERLVPLLQRGKDIARIIEMLAWIKDDWENSPITGPFCSELVAMLYARLSLPLFEKESEPEKVAPNDFVKSNLVHLKGAILCRDEIVDFNPQTWEPDGTPATSGDDLAEIMRRNRILEHDLDTFDQIYEKLPKPLKVILPDEPS